VPELRPLERLQRMPMLPVLPRQRPVRMQPELRLPEQRRWQPGLQQREPKPRERMPERPPPRRAA
jgi:hypothetical protein